jgi:hypothetical protein
MYVPRIGQNPLKDVDSRVFTRMLHGKHLARWHWPLDLWPWKSIGFQTLIRTMYVPWIGQNPLKDVDSRVFTRMLCGKNLIWWPGPLTLKINRVPDSLKDYICTKFGQNPLKDVDPRVFTRMWRTDGSVTISLRNFVGEGITKDRVTRTPLKTRGELRCSGKVSSSCSTSCTHSVNLVTNPVISHEWVKDREMFTTSVTYPWSFVTMIFHSGQPSHGGDRKTFN